MRTLLTPAGSFLTGADVADAVLAYSVALACGHVADVVEMPYLTPENQPARVKLTVGYGAMMASLAHPGDEDVEDLAFLDDLRVRTGALSPQGNDLDGDVLVLDWEG